MFPVAWQKKLGRSQIFAAFLVDFMYILPEPNHMSLKFPTSQLSYNFSGRRLKIRVGGVTGNINIFLGLVSFPIFGSKLKDFGDRLNYKRSFCLSDLQKPQFWPKQRRFEPCNVKIGGHVWAAG
jgi:hypothetical protein